MLGEFDHEMASTRATLARLPESKVDYKPDPKSMSLGQLAGHIVEMVGWATMVLTTPGLDMNPGDHKPFIPKSQAEALAALDQNVKTLRATLAGTSDADMMHVWTLKIGGQEIFSLPRAAAMRTMIMNHIIHHRAQLTVYYRLNGVPVPALYGPSADESSMAASA